MGGSGTPMEGRSPKTFQRDSDTEMDSSPGQPQESDRYDALSDGTPGGAGTSGYDNGW